LGETTSSQNQLGIISKGKINMKNKAILFAGLLTGLFLMPGLASAQGQTSSGTLTVTATV
jgi:hypothetical protein